MSRRDTIIVAVLINAGLLIVLFASALKSNSSHEEFVAGPTPIVQDVPSLAFKKEIPPITGDEVDVALSQFAQNSTLTAAGEIKPFSPVNTTSNFVDDLKSLATLEATVAPTVQTPTSQTLTAPTLSPFIEVKVKKGDVLEKIARQHHTTVAEIMKANKLTSSNLRIGQTLKIPNKAIKKAEPSSTVFSPQNSTEEGVVYYTVKKGDSPWTIAVKNHLKVEDLLKLNKMSEEQARRLKPGDQLRIK